MTPPTIEEFFKTEFEIWEQEYPELKAATKRKLAEFTKIHVVGALKALSNTELEYQRALNHLYPLENIK